MIYFPMFKLKIIFRISEGIMDLLDLFKSSAIRYLRLTGTDHLNAL